VGPATAATYDVEGVANVVIKLLFLPNPSLDTYGLCSCLDDARCRLKCYSTLLPLSFSGQFRLRCPPSDQRHRGGDDVAETLSCNM
jgi:hypothetical protein